MMTVTDRDDVRLFLQDILHRIERFELTHELGVEDLFTTRFMHEHSAFDSFDEMVTAAGVVIVRSIAELETNDQWQRFISGRTTFETWDQMREEAARAWIANELGLTQSEPGAAPWQRHLPSLPLNHIRQGN